MPDLDFGGLDRFYRCTVCGVIVTGDDSGLCDEHKYDEQVCESCCSLVGQDLKCSKSKRNCGHHCNHIWESDMCCWCKEEWREEDATSSS